MNQHLRFALAAVLLALTVALAMPPLTVGAELGAAVLMLPGSTARTETSPASGPRVAVLAELFTSEGCSSCPAADALLRRLIREQPIEGVEVIGISEHVDYWNRLGWTDPFSSSVFTARQNGYARVLGADQIYTPQLVIDGRLQVIGSDLAAVRRALLEAARAEHGTVAVTATAAKAGAMLHVEIDVRGLAPATSGPSEVVVALVEDNLVTDVNRGENARRRLPHDGVARLIEVVGTIGSGHTAGAFAHDVAVQPTWVVSSLRAVAFVQADRTQRVLAAATTK
ncbi:MAG TPA: DUF1223 domain-containing protein [Vicinamibacterales bacterium]|nr:DUF1223 domain-containing protein [Vicinamibacterales bacterium]